jgi:phytol kinase
VTRGDVVGLIASYVYAFALLAIVEALGRRLDWKQRFTRKLTHIGAGMWVVPMVMLFDDWRWGLIPFATFIGLNYVFYRRGSWKAMDTEASSPGTVYFALSVTLLLAFFWRDGDADRVTLAVAAIMAMTWGDAMASLVGQRWGRRTYRVFGHTRSLEGSAAMALATAVATAASLLLVPGSALSPMVAPYELGTAVIMVATVTVAATAAEAVSPAGTDNLSVPLISGICLFLLDGGL